VIEKNHVESDLESILGGLIYTDQYYIVVKTKFTTHHIERTTYTDRGKIKWIAETDIDAFDAMSCDEEARQSHIDGGDLFPRLYFHKDSFLKEFFTWLKIRGLTITDITTPQI
jgi:hypothetical protein